MADTYFTIPDEKGSINISEDVIAAITGNALSELEGIAAFSNTAGSELSELIGKKSISKGIRVCFSESEITIDATILVHFGGNITELSKRAQEAISTAVDSITGVKPVVNIRVAGISFEK